MDCRKHQRSPGYFIESFNVVVCLQCLKDGKYSLIVKDAYEMELKKQHDKELAMIKKLDD
jgi:hypothetical protein